MRRACVDRKEGWAETKAAASQVMSPFIGWLQALSLCIVQSLPAAAKPLGIFVLWASLSRCILSSLHREPERRKRNAHCTAFRQSLHCLIAERSKEKQVTFLFGAISTGLQIIENKKIKSDLEDPLSD